MANPSLVRTWLARLGMRCVPTREEEDLTVRVDGYVEGFADMPDGVFCNASLEAMARLFDLFPAYAKLRRGLEFWLKRNPLPTPQVALPGLDDVMAALERAALPTVDKLAVRLWLERRAKRDVPPSVLDTRLAALRRHHSAGYHWLIGSATPAGEASLEAARIAVTHKWDDDGGGAWTRDPDAVRASVAKICNPPHSMGSYLLNLLRSIVRLHAPENLPLVPEVGSAAAAEPPAPQPRKPATIPPEVLAQLRAGLQAEKVA